jgi:hypothetical protein
MDCSTSKQLRAKAIGVALRQDGYKVNSKEDARGKFWEVVGDDQTILEFWFSPMGVVIAPSRMDRSCDYLSIWSYVRYVIRAIEAQSVQFTDLTCEPIKPRQEDTQKLRQRKSHLEVVQ